MKEEFYKYKENTNEDEYQAYSWLPKGEVRCVHQIVHGMTEHIGRYGELAKFLTEEGVAVVGFDLRGHGINGEDKACASFGEGGWDATLEDIHQLHCSLKEKYADAKHYLLGFSLGSFLVREYFSTYENHGFAGTIIMGTGQQPALVLSAIMAIVKGEVKKVGHDNTTDLVRTLSFGTYNKKFSPNRTKADWLCSDETELEKYIADSLNKEDISAGLFWQLLASMKRTAGKNTYQKWNINMPVLLLSGGEDPVGDAGKGVRLVEKSMKNAGLENVTMKLYPGARHDILHEEKSGVERDVYQTIKDMIV